MSATENNHTGTLDEHLRLGAGFAAADRPRILRALSALSPHLSVVGPCCGEGIGNLFKDGIEARRTTCNAGPR